MTAPHTVLDFWFAPTAKPLWFATDADFDGRVREALLELHERAVAGAFEGWRDTPAGRLALILLFDQAPRNMFRGAPRAFATDDRALALAHEALDRADDLGCRADRRVFLYLPFEHSESLEDQRAAVFLFRTRLGDARYLDFAERHLRIIERFGRFPHRNGILGRDSTPEELEFLREPNSSF